MKVRSEEISKWLPPLTCVTRVSQRGGRRDFFFPRLMLLRIAIVIVGEPVGKETTTRSESHRWSLGSSYLRETSAVGVFKT